MCKNFSLENKNIILTGGAGLLGQAICQSFLDAGANVALLDINKSALDKISKTLRVKTNNYFNTYSINLTKEDHVNSIINLVSKKYGSIDVLFNNAATKGSSLEEFLKPYEEYSYDTWKEILEGNLSSMFLMTKAVGNLMKKQNFGNIIQVASIYGIVTPKKEIYKDSFYNGSPISSPASYSVSKSGVIALTKYLASYWGEFNIRVNSISPGGIESGQNENFVNNYSSKTSLKRMATTKDIIGVANFLSSDASSYITGQNIVVDGGFTL